MNIVAYKLFVLRDALSFYHRRRRWASNNCVKMRLRASWFLLGLATLCVFSFQLCSLSLQLLPLVSHDEEKRRNRKNILKPAVWSRLISCVRQTQYSSVPVVLVLHGASTTSFLSQSERGIDHSIASVSEQGRHSLYVCMERFRRAKAFFEKVENEILFSRITFLQIATHFRFWLTHCTISWNFLKKH